MHSYPTGLSYSLDVTIRGLRLVLGGYNDKLPAFAAEVRLIKALHLPSDVTRHVAGCMRASVT